MDELSARERFLHYDGDIEAEAIGDSTLQVLSQRHMILGEQSYGKKIIMSFYSVSGHSSVT